MACGPRSLEAGCRSAASTSRAIVCALLSHAPVVVDAEIPADADDPRLKVRATVERGERLEDLQEDILGEIFGLVVLADELVGDVEDLAPVLPDDRLPRGLVAAQALLDQAVRCSRLRGR